MIISRLFGKTGMKTGLARIRSARASLMATAGLLVVLSLLAPQLFWVCLLGFVIILAAGFFTSRSGNVRKLRQMVERRQQRTWPRNAMKSIVEALDNPAFILDGELIIRYANQAGNECFGTTNAGDPLSFKFRTPEFWELVNQVIENNERQKIEFYEGAETDRWFHVECIPVPKIRNSTTVPGPSKFFLLIFIDVTQLRKTEQIRSDFVANASHELRTPLSSLRGYIETLQGPARDDDEARTKFLDIMLAQAERMSRLIDDLLSLSRIEMKAYMPPDKVLDLAALLSEVTDEMKPTAVQYDTDIQYNKGNDSVEIVGDHDELIQVFQNIIENACKYSGQNSLVKIELTVENKVSDEPQYAVVSISDNGVGIAKIHIPRLTERFFRVPQESGARPKGTGLGLAIVKHIIARHKGELEIESDSDKGTTVTVKLPVS